MRRCFDGKKIGNISHANCLNESSLEHSSTWIANIIFRQNRKKKKKFSRIPVIIMSCVHKLDWNRSVIELEKFLISQGEMVMSSIRRIVHKTITRDISSEKMTPLWVEWKQRSALLWEKTRSRWFPNLQIRTGGCNNVSDIRSSNSTFVGNGSVSFFFILQSVVWSSMESYLDTTTGWSRRPNVKFLYVCVSLWLCREELCYVKWTCLMPWHEWESQIWKFCSYTVPNTST